jgi:hypothetical protein
MNKLINWAYRIFGLVPLLWAVSLVIFHYFVVSEIGFQPTYNNPAHLDNNLIWNWGYYELLFFIVSGSCLVLFFLLFLFHVALRIIKKVKINYLNIIISSIGLLIAVIVNFIHVFSNTLTWLFD